ncbi:ATP-binding cassette domain-containing protein [Streptomyces sp. NPDC088812]|uniref:ATP-binding cassette domain-containing protein n=1 Tax=Streptomyces sp. NPDC088812 TaxID=3365905 RepID=UPI0038267332
MRNLRLWMRLFRWSWRRAPFVTAVALAVAALSVAAAAGIALSLRMVVDGSVQGALGTALAGAMAAALCYAAGTALDSASGDLRTLAADKVYIFDLTPRIFSLIADIEGLDHLERTDFLDRIDLVRGSGWQIATSLWALVLALQSALQLVVTLLLLGTVSPWLLALLLFAAVPVWTDRRAKHHVASAEQASAEAMRLQRHLLRLATRADSGKDIRVAGAGDEIARRQVAATEEAVCLRHRARVRAAGWRFGGWAFFAAGFLAALALVVRQAADDHASTGDVVMAIAVATGLRRTVQHAVGATTDAWGSLMAIESYFWLEDYAKADRSRTAGTVTAPAVLSRGITFDKVSYRYPGTDRPAITDISLSIPAGTVVAVVGEYGSGKTTLVKLLAKFYAPDSGRITVDGTDLADLGTTGWRSRISAAFQDFGRFQTVFAEGVGLGDLPHVTDRARIAHALREADGSALLARLPAGLDTQLGRDLGGVELSEGQWQRVALARSVMREDPVLFILDEPTASLDAPSEHAIFERHMDRARELAARTGAITVIVSHRFSTVTGADLILVLDKGRLIESGTHEELVAREGGQYADLYGLQAQAYSESG